ncbi:MAG: type III polyketide synthase [Deltaproteobacteria bacterium]|nr:type III polyketide synthase [Deltaproteobacteria bacterium]
MKTVVPPHVLTAGDLKRLGREMLGHAISGGPDAFDDLVERTCIERRFLSRPAEELVVPRALEMTTSWHAESALRLAKEALVQAIDEAGVSRPEIDAIVACCSTGFMIPSLDSYLINELGFPATTRRYPFTTLGCAGGAGGLIRAAEIACGLGDRGTVALVAVETPTLTFRPRDLSMQNVVSALLFGDGASAMVVRSSPPPGRRSVFVKGSSSFLHRDTYDAMGFGVVPDGFKVQLSPKVPELAARDLRSLVSALLKKAGSSVDELAFFALHPGGPRVLKAVEAELGLTRAQTAASWKVLREHGNMSSPTVMFVLAEILGSQPLPIGALGVMAAFGPGFAVELALLEVTGPG